MGSKRKKVLIFGAGPAGLSAGVHLLEKGEQNNFDVTIVNLDHNLGGKAGSWEDPVFNDGRFYDHGIHFVFGFYKNLLELMARAGINEKEILVPNNGRWHWYEKRDNKLHTLRLRGFYPLNLAMGGAFWSEFTFYEKANLAQWFGRNSDEIFLKEDISYLDDVCFTVWALENGMDYGAVKTNFFRFFREAFFNWPYEVSAFLCLKAMRHQLFSKEQGYSIVNQGWSSAIWNPIGDYYKKLGGKFMFNHKLVGFRHDGWRITGVEIGQTGMDDGKSKVIPIKPGSERVISDFDYVISTLPLPNLLELNPDDKVIWDLPYFSAMHNLKWIAPMGTFAFLKEDLKVPYRTHINGIDSPLFNAVDYKPICKAYKNNNRFGSVIHMQGQETTFEHLSDKEMVDLGLKLLSYVEGFKGIKKATLLDHYVYRGNRNHSLYLLTDPGTYRFRPKVKSPFKNLYLAGDWLQHDIVIPSMEGATITGKEAADYVLEECGVRSSRKA